MSQLLNAHSSPMRAAHSAPTRALYRGADAPQGRGLDPAALTTEALARAEGTLPWLREMPERRRDLMWRITEAGIRSFLRHFDDPASADPMEMFMVAPRELVRSVTLQQTLQLMRITSTLVEEHVATDHERDASVIFSRQLAFAAAELYARVGDGTGLWERRLEQYVVDAATRGPLSDSLHQRIRAVGWRGNGAAIALCGSFPTGGDTDRLRRLAWDAGADLLVGEADDRLIAIAELVDCDDHAALDGVIAAVADGFGPGPVLVGPPIESLPEAWRSLAAATRAAAVVVDGDAHDRVVAASEVLPERALAGDESAREELVQRHYEPLLATRQPLLETLRRFIEAGGIVESTATRLDVHPNTVRYRLKRISEISGLDPTKARDSFVLQCALRLGLTRDARR